MMLRSMTILISLTLFCWQSFGQEVRQFTYTENGQIEYDTARLHLHKSYQIVEGDYTVFEFTSNNGGDPGNHSQAESKIVFQLPMGHESFVLEGEDIASHGGIYIQLCRCQDKGIQVVTDGKIEGRKLDRGNWKIDLDVSFSGRKTEKKYHITANGIYNIAAH